MDFAAIRDVRYAMSDASIFAVPQPVFHMHNWHAHGMLMCMCCFPNVALHRSQIYRAARARFDFACASKAWPGAYEYEVNRTVDSREASFSKFFAEV